eukprot:TRINITY_DN79413_c0_g1_i1.p1 TRINITY_DN79413_c0_g1~~TRINITY_DN79413_c0_g1_i1.p1  ORF type:complete len:296 (-),score=45.46 TRINITY_DN79413_c0_g1_i1:79-966(-)
MSEAPRSGWWGSTNTEAPDVALKVGPLACFCFCGAQDRIAYADDDSLSDFIVPEKRGSQIQISLGRQGSVSFGDQGQGQGRHRRIAPSVSDDAPQRTSSTVSNSLSIPPGLRPATSLQNLYTNGRSGTPSESSRQFALRARSMSSSHLAEEKPNFSGKWLLVRVEGDFDTFLKELGVSYLSRSTASAFGYGVKTIVNVITLTDDRLEVYTKTPLGENTQTVFINGQEQDCVDAFENKPIKVTPEWDGAVLLCKSRRADSSAPLPSNRRFMVGEEMFVESELPNGLVIKRIFARTS